MNKLGITLVLLLLCGMAVGEDRVVDVRLFPNEMTLRISPDDAPSFYVSCNETCSFNISNPDCDSTPSGCGGNVSEAVFSLTHELHTFCSNISLQAPSCNFTQTDLTNYGTVEKIVTDARSLQRDYFEKEFMPKIMDYNLLLMNYNNSQSKLSAKEVEVSTLRYTINSKDAEVQRIHDSYENANWYVQVLGGLLLIFIAYELGVIDFLVTKAGNLTS